MSDPQKPRSQRRVTVIIVAVLVVVIAAVALIAVLASRSSAPATTTTPSSAVTSSTSSSDPPTTPSRSAAPVPTVTSSAPDRAVPSPQPTKTTALSSSAPIRKSLTAAVTKLEAVQGTATGPGEIAGPSVRFTVRITNGTSKAVSLSDTVVNTYAGKDQSPAVELSGPGGKDLPTSVAPGSTVSGVFIFNIPKSERSQVTVTVDTSTSNPVLAFKGAAP